MRSATPRPAWVMVAAVATMAIALCDAAVAAGPGSGLCATVSDGVSSPPYVAVLSAFPAELAPLVASARIDAATAVGGQSFYTGTIDGVSVVLGLLGIGLVNAERSAENVLTGFDVAALIVDGVAGSHHRIGDVVVPSRWIERRRRRGSPTNRALSALARRGASALQTSLERCTTIPPSDPSGEVVCLPFEPTVVFERTGVSDDPFAGAAVACIPGGGEIFGCDLPVATSTSSFVRSAIAEPAAELASALALPAPRVLASRADADVEDMETAAAARVARRHRVAFLGIRAVSDGAGDPLGDRGFPAQFFDYYRLAAVNGASTVRAALAEIGALARDQDSIRTCELLAARRWRAAAARLTDAGS